jgi:Lar family restriction alleviation protein
VSDLLPCPFCGKEAYRSKFRNNFMCYCSGCGIQGAHAKTQDKADAAWNTRKPAPVSQGAGTCPECGKLIPPTRWYDQFHGIKPNAEKEGRCRSCFILLNEKDPIHGQGAGTECAGCDHGNRAGMLGSPFKHTCGAQRKEEGA